MKKLRFILTVIAMSLYVCGWGYDFYENGLCYNIISESDKTVEVVNQDYREEDLYKYYYEYEGAITIPEKVTNNSKWPTIEYTVVKIADYAFYGSANLTEVSLPSTIHEIGDNAFMNCTSLSAINFPNELIRIGASSFEYCLGLNLKGDFLPNNIQYLGDDAFSDVPIYDELIIPSSVTYIGKHCFSKTKIESIMIKRGFAFNVCEIGDYAFSWNVNLQKIDFDYWYFYVGVNPFVGCDNLSQIKKDDITMRNGDRYKISENCIYRYPNENKEKCELICCPASLSSYTFPNDVFAISESAFFGCNKIVELIIPEGVTSIGYMALGLGESGISGRIETTLLQHRIIKIPSSVTNFEECILGLQGPNLEVYLNQKEPPKSIALLFKPKENKNILHIPFLSKSSYMESKHWGEGFFITFIDDIDKPTTYTISDKEKYEIESEYDFEKIKYNRTFNNTNWQALYVPFSMSYDDWKDEFEVGKINDVNMYDMDDDGEFDVTEVELLKIKRGSIEANTPYFIKAKTTGDKVIYLENATLYPAEENYVDCSSTEMRFIFQGTYSGVSGEDMYANKYYALASGSLCYAQDATVSLKPMRWYMKSEARNNRRSALTNNVRLRVVGEDATEIADLKADKKVDMTYALDGRVVNTDNLKKGMYIQNGKKIIIR